MSRKHVVIVGAILVNVGLLVALYLHRRAEDQAAEAEAAVVAGGRTSRPPVVIDQQVPQEQVPNGQSPEQMRESAFRSQSKNNLRMLALALHNYADRHKSFPAGTHPNEMFMPEDRLSWIADVLPYLDQQAAFQTIDFTKGWSDPVHEKLRELNLPLLHTPAMTEGDTRAAGITQYVGIAGVGPDAPMLPVTDKRAGVFGYNRVVTFTDIKDGTSSTIVITEANKDFGPWIAGGKGTVRGLTEKPYINGPDGIGGPFMGGVHAAMGDGSVRFISEKIDPAVFEAMTTIAGGEPIPQ